VQRALGKRDGAVEIGLLVGDLGHRGEGERSLGQPVVSGAPVHHGPALAGPRGQAVPGVVGARQRFFEHVECLAVLATLAEQLADAAKHLRHVLRGRERAELLGDAQRELELPAHPLGFDEVTEQREPQLRPPKRFVSSCLLMLQLPRDPT
jgi:hypothetical protein